MYFFLVILILPWLPRIQLFCDLRIRQVDDYLQKRYRNGDLIIGGLFTVHEDTDGIEEEDSFHTSIICTQANLQGFIHVLIFIFAIDNINKNPEILPNITLGYHVYDSCLDIRVSVQRVLHLLSGPGKMIPNYSCRKHGQLAGMIGDQHSSTTIPVAQILGIYGYPQISYGATDHSLSDRRLYPHVFRTVRSHHVHNMVITKLLKHFGWTWVGIIVSDDDAGENELQMLTKYMREHGICAAFTIKITEQIGLGEVKIPHVLTNPKVSIFLMCGTYHRHVLKIILKYADLFCNKTFILPPSWAFSELITHYQHKELNGSLAVDFSSQTFPEAEDFVKNYRKFPIILQSVLSVNDLHFIAGNKDKDSFVSYKYRATSATQTKPSLMNFLSSGVSPRLYYAVEVLAKALHEMFLFIKDKYPITGLIQHRRKLQRYLQMTKSSLDPMRPSYYFTDQGEAVHPYSIINWIFRNKTSHTEVREVEVGNFTPLAGSGQKLYMNDHSITWKHTKEKPLSRCNDPCSPGYRKAPNGGYHICCYDCVPCSEGEFSNVTDSETCHKCPEEESPDEKKEKCVPKTYEFLSYEKDIIVHIFLALTLFLSAITLFILRSFIHYWDTPIVKANNRTLSFILLVSILLGFLSVFFFLGRPVNITCKMRQISFGIFFSIGVSSVLAKTITVCIAFKATKPGSGWAKCVSLQLSNFVVLVCSSVQVLICVIWLLVSPPYIEYNHHTYPGSIIIQCNEGSDIWFYSMLGYLGFLAAVSFVLAFMVRTLPDAFNEAKYITFSMLLFCSVWIAMIPAYLSTKGKYMVAVEIFAILTSCAGILGCIFFPKLYILLLKPNFNSRNLLMEKKNYN